ncbi:hypothetical protein [Pseudoalteromonas aurantia]|uniref:Uncharacterized protein n=1 Tax=Pseudoalteromonas aurantia TaxID=43654 RepID=A0A5S3V1I5_9GAMM|nr:hypothetical protein [Pseudoalteromonas aurantia]TMO64442.1 hypothetical protein CWC19_18395 [Pseudoalteromonas aurantia]
MSDLQNMADLVSVGNELLDDIRGGAISKMQKEHDDKQAEFAQQKSAALNEFNQTAAQEVVKHNEAVAGVLGEAGNRLNPFFSRVDNFVSGRFGIIGHAASYKPDVPVAGYVLWTIPDYAAGDRQNNIGFSGEITFHRNGWNQLSAPIKVSAHAAYASEYSYIKNAAGEHVESYAGLRFETLEIDGKQTRVLFCERSGAGSMLFDGIVHRGGSVYHNLQGIETRGEYFGYAIKRNADLSYSVNTDKQYASDMLLDIARRAK